ncbi:Opine oxidase subunit A [hydrothermal vent metagenome]|uniref:Opine oxidase subunit A n=1 Tax=hydrothermal vent metagenome TaxID=652676 RepID=A0A3B1DNW2_9ZZZZ
MIHRKVVIVGAGPAGMSAAIAIANAGLHVTLIDENPLVGGQIYRRPPQTFKTNKLAQKDSVQQRGAELRSRLETLKDRIELLTQASVWGIFPNKKITVTLNDGWEMISAEHLVLATGAYEYVPPFPGWTLPGVMTPGSAQLMAKTMHVQPGKRILLAGTGPFLLVVASYLQQQGVEVVGIVETARIRDGLLALPRLLAEPGLLKQGWRYLRALKKAGIPIYRGHVILEARGDDSVQEVVFAPCDAEWFPDRSRPQTVQVDTLCVGYGFVPRTQLAQLAGCQVNFVNEQGGWIPTVDENLQSSVPGIWIAGDGGGVAGAFVAELEGQLVGLTIANSVGEISQSMFDQKRQPIMRRLAKLRRFRAAMDRISNIRGGLSSLAEDETMVCRCEELKLDQINTSIAAGGTDIRTLKVMTRLGMGACQGRMCWSAMCRHIANRTTRPVETIGPLSIRPPVKPVTLGTLAADSKLCKSAET